METHSKGVLFADLAGRILSGALGWLLVFLGALGVLVSLLVYFGEYPGKSSTLSAISFGTCLLVIVIGIYGNPRIRERIHPSLG